MARRAALPAPEDPQVPPTDAPELDAPVAESRAALPAPEAAAGDQGEEQCEAPACPPSDEPEAEPAAVFVTMVRDAEGDGPTTAQVHPDEVENFAKGGWRPE